MFIKISQLMAISLLLLVGCSEKSNNTNDSNLPGSSSTPASNANIPIIPTDQPAPNQNPTDSVSVIVGRWQSRYNATAPISGNYQIITTVEFYSDGTYKFGVYDTSKDPLRFQNSGQWKRTDENTIFANTQNPDSGKINEHKYRTIDQDTIIDSYGNTFIRLP